MTSGGSSAASSDRLARLIEETAPGAWDWDARTHTFVITPRLRDVFGFSPADNVDLAALAAAAFSSDRGWTDGIDKLPIQSDPILRRFRILKNGAERWIAARIWNRGAEGHSGTVEDITDHTETAMALTESEERLRLAIEAGKMAVWEVDLETQTMTQSPELNLLLGFPPGETVTLAKARALYNPGEFERVQKEGVSAEAIRARAHGGAFEPWRRRERPATGGRTQVQAEIAITTRAGVPKHLLLRSQYAPFPDGRPRLTGLLIDITETKQAQLKLGTVARELQHRVKNSLSVVYALAMKTLRGKADEEALRTFLERLRALAAANDLILDRGSDSAPLQNVIEQIVKPYRDVSQDPFTLNGPPVSLHPNAAIASGMVLHELCTNAVKYGALSRPEGRITVHWTQPASDRIDLTWQERGGPAVEKPARHGFGMRLLDSLLSGEGGKVTLDFQPAGVTCKISLPLNH
jgi:two-component sensor histidine kinase/PAS domain-containing protein